MTIGLFRCKFHSGTALGRNANHCDERRLFMAKKIWILAGEASGDLYGAALTRELHKLGWENGEKVEVSGMGGMLMAAENFRLLVDSTELGVIGIVEILRHIFTFINIFFKLVRIARKERPDTVVLIDYPGFNLLFALVMYFSRIKTVWYVCPHVWVWGKWRLPVLAKICRRMLVIFPFECEVFAKTRLNAEFVGHPLVNIVKKRTDPSVVRDEKCFLLLPGSRRMEIERLMKPMLETVCALAKKHPELYYVVSAPRESAARQCEMIIEDFIRRNPDMPKVKVESGRTAYYLQKAAAGIAASGTVTVECAIAGLPLAVVYKLNWITLLIAGVLVKLYRGFFTMTNIIADKEVFPEFLQRQVNCRNLLPAAESILPGGVRREQVEREMTEVRLSLENASGDSPERAAALKVWEEACGK